MVGPAWPRLEIVCCAGYHPSMTGELLLISDYKLDRGLRSMATNKASRGDSRGKATGLAEWFGLRE